MKNNRFWIFLFVVGSVFGIAATAIFILALFDVRIFAPVSSDVFVWDVLFLASALFLSSVIVTVSIYLKNRK